MNVSRAWKWYFRREWDRKQKKEKKRGERKRERNVTNYVWFEEYFETVPREREGLSQEKSDSKSDDKKVSKVSKISLVWNRKSQKGIGRKIKIKKERERERKSENFLVISLPLRAFLLIPTQNFLFLSRYSLFYIPEKERERKRGTKMHFKSRILLLLVMITDWLMKGQKIPSLFLSLTY